MSKIEKLNISYRESMWNELIMYWKSSKEANLNIKNPWFGPLHLWIEEFSGSRSTLLEDFSQKLSKKFPGISVELNFLLPNMNKDTDQKHRNIRTFLPLIVWAYCLKRRKPQNKEEYSPLFNLVAYSVSEKDHNITSDTEKRISVSEVNSYRNMVYVSSWESEFPALKVHNVMINRPNRYQNIYARALFFFFLLKKFRDMCNLTMSFIVFMKESGYLELFGAKAEELVNSFLAAQKPLESDFGREEVLAFVDWVLKEPKEITLIDEVGEEMQVLLYKEALCGILRKYHADIKLTEKQNAVLKRIERYLFDYKTDDCRDLSHSNKCKALDWAKKLFHKANVEFGLIQGKIKLPEEFYIKGKDLDSFRVFSANLQTVLLEREVSKPNEKGYAKYTLVPNDPKDLEAWNELDEHMIEFIAHSKKT